MDSQIQLQLDKGVIPILEEGGTEQTIVTISDFKKIGDFRRAESFLSRIIEVGEQQGWEVRGGNIGLKHAEEYAQDFRFVRPIVLS